MYKCKVLSGFPFLDMAGFHLQDFLRSLEHKVNNPWGDQPILAYFQLKTPSKSPNCQGQLEQVVALEVPHPREYVSIGSVGLLLAL